MRVLARGCGSRVALLTIGCSLALSCGGGDTGTVEVTLEFPFASAEARAATVHVWVLRAVAEDGPGCTELVAQVNQPYDGSFQRRGDSVIFLPADDGVKAEDVDSGSALAYVEVVDALGVAYLAGCDQVDVSGGTTDVTLSLRAPGSYDCADPVAEDADPCDDGDLCTVSEECRTGTCSNGIDLDCSFLDGPCSSATCDPEVGCVVDQLPDLTSCVSGDFCTVAEVCTDGNCQGADRDCTAELGLEGVQCHVGYCNEDSDYCQNVSLNSGGCTDDNPCTIGDHCVTGSCIKTGNELNGTLCNDGDACTMNTTCNTGLCNAGVPTDIDGDTHLPEACGGNDCNDGDPDVHGPGTFEATANANCADGIDNDCDGLADNLDPNC